VKSVWRAFLLLALCALTSACAWLEHGQIIGGTESPANAKSIAVASTVTLALLPAADVLHDVTLTQRIDASYSKAGEPAQTRSFVVQIEADANDMRMVGLTPMGVQLFAVTLNGAELAVDVPPYLSLPFDPRFMLADMQLALADVASLNSHLVGAQMRVTSDGQRRELVAGDDVRMRIDYRGKSCTEGSETHIEHIERHYQIHITTLSCDPS
jgi:hypothetical protein